MKYANFCVLFCFWRRHVHVKVRRESLYSISHTLRVPSLELGQYKNKLKYMVKIYLNSQENTAKKPEM